MSAEWNNKLNEVALRYTKTKLSESKMMKEFMDEDIMLIYMLIENAIQYYNDGCYAQYIQMNNGGNLDQ